jgi:SAM-dependent methyltransferase
MSINRVLTESDRELYEKTRREMQNRWPELYSRKIPDSLVQFCFAYDFIRSQYPDDDNEPLYILSAGSHEDIVGESLKFDGESVLDIDPVFNSDLHTFYMRHPYLSFDVVLSASVLEHVENDEEFVADACKFLRNGGYGVFTMDFKADWKPGQPVPYTSRRFYTPSDLTRRLRSVLKRHGCDLVEEPDYSAADRFVWDGIPYSFATWIFRKG